MPTPRTNTSAILALLMLALALGVAAIAVVASTQTTPSQAAGPPFPEHAPWLNVSRPLTAEDLRGHVVLLDFFTPGCINCIHVLPETAKLEREFGRRLLVIGVNSPKFTASEQTGNIQGFIRRYGIRHPIITDAGMALWNHYGVFAWPTQVLLGPDGKVVGRYIGEGKYEPIRRDLIRTLASGGKEGALKDTALPLKPMAHVRRGLLQPGKVAVSTHYVAVSDTGHNRVLLLDHSGHLIKAVGDGVRGNHDGAPGQAEFDGPQGLAFDGGVLYVADTGNALIRAVTLSSGEASTIAGNGEQGYGIRGMHPARAVGLSSPWGLQLVGRQLYIAMAGSHQIWSLDLDEGRVGPFAGSGAEGIADGPLRLASFAQSSALTYHDGELYVADPEGSAVRRIGLRTHQVATLIGAGLFVFGLRDGAAGQALLQHAQGLIWLDHRLYIADTFNNAVRVLDLRTNKVSTLATGLSQPGGLAALDKDTLLVADTNADRILTVDVRTGQVRSWPLKGL